MSDAPDPVTLSLVRQLLEAAAAAMGDALQRTAVSANIKERRDFSCALFDDHCRLIAQAAHVPVHLGSMQASVEAAVREMGEKSSETFILNDPFAGGTHLPDVTLVSPVYAEEHLIGYVASRAHHADVGGRTPGSMGLATHIDDEGVRLPPVRFSIGKVKLLASARNPAEREADLEAQQIANERGAEQFRRLAETHGPAGLKRLTDTLLDQSAERTRAALRQLPTGEWRGEARLDDGTAIRLALASRGETLVADFRASDDQTQSCLNCPAAVTLAATCYAVTCLVNAIHGDDPSPNAGTFEPIQVVTRPACAVAAVHPAAVAGGNTETSQRVVDAVFDALRQALPDLIPAESCGTMSSIAFGGEGGGGWTYYETIGGGSGAGSAGVGQGGVQCHMTNTLNTPAEALELQYPLRVRRYALRDGSGGEGMHRGGDGIVREIEFLADGHATLLSERRVLAPRGANNGGDGQCGRDTLNGSPLPGRAEFAFKAGDTLRIETEVVELRTSKSRPNAGIVTFIHRAYNQEGELVASCKRSGLQHKKPHESSVT